MTEHFYQTLHGTLTVTTNLNQFWPESNINEEVIYIPKTFRTVASPSESGYYYTRDTFWVSSYDYKSAWRS